MMMENQNYILFESYLSHALSDHELVAFELRLKNDPTFHKAFLSYKELSSFLEHTFENEAQAAIFQNNLKNISNAYFEKQYASKKRIQFKPWQYAIAASVAVLVGIFMFHTFSNPSFDDYNDYETLSLMVRGENDSVLQTAENAFNSGDFASAESAFKQLIAEDGHNAELKLYSAISNIELNDFELADALLLDLREGHSAYKNKATWYLALSKLKQKDYEASLEILKTIPKDADHYKEAQKLVKKLD
ncbi:tetratricopeptide repeat protein [Mariniflexile ostreae]|uniref:Tetratricopeptide repeat protein n=1 Tax=Mariniflexile ostreae TaxID=1520892 RepID=A0ABV5F923_9FLAO